MLPLLIVPLLIAFHPQCVVIVEGFDLRRPARPSHLGLKAPGRVPRHSVSKRTVVAWSKAKERSTVSSPNRRTQLNWLVNNVEKRKEAEPAEISSSVFQALQQLARAKTSKQVSDAGRLLESTDIANECSPEVQERIINAASMTGLIHQALNWTNLFFLEQERLPSDIAQASLCTSLRKASRYADLEELVLRLGGIAVSHNTPMSLSAFNIFLASLSDQACPRLGNRRSRYVSKPIANTKALQQAWDWIRKDDKTQARLGIQPDEVSFATVLQAAAKAGNRSLSDEIWEFLKQRNLPRNVNACNARLKTLVLSSTGTQQRQTDDSLALELWEEMTMVKDDPNGHNFAPDRYTIDLMLMVWVRQEQQQCLGDGAAWKTIETVLDKFCSEQTYLVSRAFESFLLRLCQNGAVFMARAVFLKYLAPRFSPVIRGCARKRLFWVDEPTTQQFNILLEGYRKILQSERRIGSTTTEERASHPKARTNVTGSLEEFDVSEEAWRLFETMQRYSNNGIGPDYVSITTMMAFCYNSSDLCSLLRMSKMGAGMSNNAVLRASITRFGELGDISSACWLFARHGGAQLSKLRLWNVLLGAIAKSCQNQHLDSVVDMRNAPVSTVNPIKVEKEEKVYLQLQDELTNCSLPLAAEKLLTLMNVRAPIGSGVVTPSPDSQSYCLVASCLQCININAERATEMFREAQQQGIPADGRFVNALLRCYGENIQEALSAWKEEIRPACVKHENRYREKPLPSNRVTGKNLLAAYHGLMYVCGRSLRPDLAVRLAYAMRKEGLEPSDVSLYSYNAGKNERPKSPSLSNKPKSFFGKMANAVPRPSWALVSPYESVLYVECSKYDQFDKRRLQEKRVRIIV